jgi:hypothetical protein
MQVKLDIKYKIILVDADRELMKNGKCGFCQAGSRYFTSLNISCHTYHRETPYTITLPGLVNPGTSSSFHLKLTCSRHDMVEKLMGWL